MSADPKFSIKSNVIQAMMMPSGLTHPDGTIKSNLVLQIQGITIKVPIEIFPFLKANSEAFVTLSIVQIIPQEPVIETPKLILQ